MATKTEKEPKTDKAGETKPKRASHVRRMKQEARKTAGTTPAHT